MEFDRAHIDAVLAQCDIMTFDGPSTAHALGHVYVTLTSGGIKPEGEEVVMFERSDDAWAAFFAQLLEYVRGARQVAWRSPPVLRGDTGKWFVSCRLVKA